jgi:hypothetical protein
MLCALLSDSDEPPIDTDAFSMRGRPAGLTVHAGTVTLNAAPATSATISGQTVRLSLGTIAAGTSALVAFKAT